MRDTTKCLEPGWKTAGGSRWKTDLAVDPVLSEQCGWCMLAEAGFGPRQRLAAAPLPDEGSALVNDVRMRGFESRTTVPQAWQWLQQFTTVTDVEAVGLTSAGGRVLGLDIVSPIDVPGFDRAAMDGYAVRADETTGASEYNPLPFQIQGESFPGRPAERAVAPGTAVRIMTGAPIPPGATAVVPAEYARERGTVVELTESVATAKNIGRKGEDISRGSVVFRRHRRLRPQDVAVLASLGLAEVPVVRRPRVRIIVTGNELALPGQPLGPFQIFDANSYLLSSLVQRDGGDTADAVHRIADCPDRFNQLLLEPGADAILISGGSSVGAEDHAPEVVRRLGTLDIHGIAMRPSSPAGLGVVQGVPVFLMPGNPVSCLCAYDFFAGRVIRRMGGLRPDWPYHRVTLPLGRKVTSSVGRVDYCRVRIDSDEVVPLAISGAGILTSTTRATGFIVIPAESEGYAAGALVEVYLYDSLSVTGASQ